MHSKRKILVVDDEPSVAITVKFILEADNFQVCTVYSGEACLKKIAEEDFDLILLDVMMPRMDGWQVFEEIKKMKSKIPVAFFTVLDYSNAMKEKMVKDGLVACINKPFENKELVERIKHLVPC